MCVVIDIMLNNGWQEAIDSGMQKGMQKGLEEGMQKGLEEGIQKGAEIEKKNIAETMKKKGLDIGLRVKNRVYFWAYLYKGSQDP